MDRAVRRQRLMMVTAFLRHELLYLVWALSEVALITPVALAFMPWARYWPSGQVALLLVLITLIPFNLSRVMSIMQVPVDRQQIVMAVGLLVTSLAALRGLLYDTRSLLDFGWIAAFVSHIGLSGNPFWPRDLAVFFLVVLMWWRGISLVGRRADIGDIGLRFRVSGLIVAPLVAVIASSQLERPVTPFILLFLISALVSIVLTRVEHLEHSVTGPGFPIGPGWLLVIVTVAVAIASLAGVVAGFASGEAIPALVGFLGPIWLALSFIATTTLAAVSYMSLPLLLLMSLAFGAIASALGPRLQNVLDNLQLTLESPFPSEIPEEAIPAPGTLDIIMRQLLALLAMLFLVLVVSLALGKLFSRIQKPSEADREYVGPAESLDLPGLAGIGRRLLTRFGLTRRWRLAASVRRIYREMCNLAAEYGFPRAESETPIEYLSTLALAWPDCAAETRVITDAYNRVRYGEVPETEEELREIWLAWQRLRQVPLVEKAPSVAEVEVRRRL